MKRTLILAYGVLAYVLFLATFVQAALFVEGWLLPRSLSAGGPSGPVWTAVLVNVGLLGAFGIQHSIMARPEFKRRWTRIIPAAAERSTFVMATNVLLTAIVWFWRPIEGVVWEVGGPAAGVIRAISWAGFGVVLVGTFLIDHFELFGLSQVWRHFRGVEAKPAQFQVRFFYRWMRHPLYFGFFVAFWATPVMTFGHLLFAGVVTTWVLLTVRLEERDLIGEHGEAYREYRRRVPMILPLGGRAPRVEPQARRRADTVGA